MKIVDVCGFYSETGGGVRSYVHHKFDAARAAGHDLTVIAPGADSRIDAFRGGKIAWVKSPLMPFDANYRRFVGSREVFAVLDAERPDVVEGSSPWRSGWLAAHWPGRAARALIFHQDFVAGYPYTALSGVMPLRRIDGLFAPYWRHVRRLSQRYDVTVTGGEWLARRLEGFGVANARAVPFGIERGLFSPDRRDEALRRDLLALCGASPNGKLLIAVGRFHPEKRQPMLIEAFAKARETRPDLGLVLIGDGLARKAVERAARKAGHVHLLGAVTDRERLAALYASADLLIHGSGAETYGLVVAEAMASGLRVVVPDAGGAADLAKEGRGSTYPLGNVAGCTAAIRDATSETPPNLPANTSYSDDHFKSLFALYERLAFHPSRLA
jgi:alpha-1,6-mannosyltransferase